MVSRESYWVKQNPWTGIQGEAISVIFSHVLHIGSLGGHDRGVHACIYLLEAH